MKFFFGSFIMPLVIFSTLCHAEMTIRITNGEWPPYFSEKLLHYGIVSRIITEAFAMEGVKVSYGFYPWKRSFVLAKNGDWDGTAAWFKSPERVQEFYLSDAVIESKYVFFHLKSRRFDWKGIDDLKNYLIGATLEYNYGEAFEQAEKNGVIKVQRVPSDEQNLKKLLNGRIDIFPLDIYVGYSMMNIQFQDFEINRMTHHLKPLRVEPLYLLLVKKKEYNRKYIDLFNRGLKKLRDSGRYDRYLKEVIKQR